MQTLPLAGQVAAYILVATWVVIAVGLVCLEWRR